jgi:hypothetical protein
MKQKLDDLELPDDEPGDHLNQVKFDSLGQYK